MSDTREFLDNFKEEIIFATIGDKETTSFRHYHSSFDKAYPYLKRDNDQGRGVFFCVNYLDREKQPEKKRTKKMFVHSRAIWVEDDTVRDKPIIKFWPIKPNLIVNTSPGKYHYYWLCKTTDMEQWEKVMNRMVQDFGCDIQARDSARVLRLPGFNHMKREPFKVTFQQLRKKPYSWNAICVAFPPLEEIELNEEQQKTVQGGAKPGQSIPELVEESKKGHKHGPSVQMALTLANKGMNKAEIMSILSLMPEYNDGDHRHSVETALKKLEQEEKERAEKEERVELPDIPESYTQKKFTYPPGLFGEMCKQTCEMAHFPFRSVAIATCIGMVAGVVGRKYNCSDFGLNMYISVLMETGMGKDTIRKIINRTLVEIDPINGHKFVGAERFTGVPAIWNMMLNGMSKVSVVTEAGLLNGSDVGDKGGLSAALLSFFTSSGAREKKNSNEYSNKENTLPMLYSPSLTLIQESTPRSFIEALLKNKGDISGELARMWLLKIDEDKPYKNRNPRKDFTPQIKNRLKFLMHDCIDCLQNEPIEKKVKEIGIPEWVHDFDDMLVDMHKEETAKGNRYRAVMLTRSWVKSVKIAALICAFNNEKEITKEIYDWVYNEVILRELNAIEKSIRGEDSSDFDNVVKEVAGFYIINLLRKPESGSLNAALAKNNIFTKNALRHVTKHNRVLKDFCSRKDSFTITDGLTKIIEYMEKSGLIEKVDKDRLRKIDSSVRAKEGYRITKDFVVMYQST